MAVRDEVLNAASRVLRTRGIRAVAFRTIASEAGIDVAAVSGEFSDERELLNALLLERVATIPADLVVAGEEDVASNLARLAEQLMAVTVRTLPLLASAFADPDLREDYRSDVTRDAAPAAAVGIVRRYLDEERRLGRIGANADTESAARLLVGMTFQQAFLAAFGGQPSVQFARPTSRAAVALMMQGLLAP